LLQGKNFASALIRLSTRSESNFYSVLPAIV
jgi:hypothetical protein